MLFRVRDRDTGGETEWANDQQLLCDLLSAVRKGNAIQAQILDRMQALEENVSYANLRGKELLDASERMERVGAQIERAAGAVAAALRGEPPPAE